MYQIIVTTPRGSAWKRSRDGFEAAEYEDREVAEAICKRLNALDVPFRYRVIERAA